MNNLHHKKLHLQLSFAKYMAHIAGEGEGLLVSGRLETRKRIAPTPAIYPANEVSSEAICTVHNFFIITVNDIFYFSITFIITRIGVYKRPLT